MSVWVYKCHYDSPAFASSYGVWLDFFSDPKDGSWGGEWSTKSPASQNTIRNLMKKGDTIVAYQTDRKEIVGQCKVKAMKDTKAGKAVYLTPVDQYYPPIKIHNLKKKNRQLLKIKAFKQGPLQAVHPIAMQEFRLILNAYKKNAKSRKSAGFGRSESNRKVERAAILFVNRWFKAKGCSIKSVQEAKLGYDFVCQKENKIRHVEVKGVSGINPEFIVTANEMRQAKTKPSYRFFVVTEALSKRPAYIRLTGSQFFRKYRTNPIQYFARLV
jgi:hypothetical protein